MEEKKKSTRFGCAVVKYLLDSVCSILVMNDDIYEAQAVPIILQHNN